MECVVWLFGCYDSRVSIMWSFWYIVSFIFSSSFSFSFFLGGFVFFCFFWFVGLFFLSGDFFFVLFRVFEDLGVFEVFMNTLCAFLFVFGIENTFIFIFIIIIWFVFLFSSFLFELFMMVFLEEGFCGIKYSCFQVSFVSVLGGGVELS
jgi:hypothetical protein